MGVPAGASFWTCASSTLSARASSIGTRTWHPAKAKATSKGAVCASLMNGKLATHANVCNGWKADISPTHTKQSWPKVDRPFIAAFDPFRTLGIKRRTSASGDFQQPIERQLAAAECDERQQQPRPAKVRRPSVRVDEDLDNGGHHQQASGREPRE